MKRLVLVAGMLTAFAAFAGEWHAGTTNLCSDCHTMHFSMQHNWDGTAPVSTTVQANGNWLGATGPNQFLLKLPANELCKACHDGQTFAPDVVGANTNTYVRQAGALNEAALGAPYEDWKGHTLDSTSNPPGFNPVAVGLGATWYNPANGLECISCHTQHGSTTVYRNLGPRNGNFQPTYTIATTNVATRDVWVNMASGYVANQGAANFTPYYSASTVTFNRNDTLAGVGTTTTSNRIDTFCGACHADFHGSPGDVNIGGSQAVTDAFIRHPTSKTTLGQAGAQGYGGHSALSRFTSATTKLKVYASDQTGWTDASPGCMSCHKAHGNQNPFGLIFLNRNAATVDEEGGYSSTQTVNQMQGYRNLCGQCHSQGNL